MDTIYNFGNFDNGITVYPAGGAIYIRTSPDGCSIPDRDIPELMTALGVYYNERASRGAQGMDIRKCQELVTTIQAIRLERTSYACPEQYDAYIGAEYVGYLRLRHGIFRVDNAVGGEVYRAYPKGDGIFECDERNDFLAAAKAAIAQSVIEETDA